ncbi:cation transporting ATPase C-terminal domain-containing protein [Spirosoma sp. KNUC1025]|nr:cation transporting ATPase C-terminal domain-containing protein [Spirosoma sp. KNUC1025]
MQILFINIVTDVFPALALGVGRENASLMEQPPRDPKTPIMDTRDWRTVVLYALAMTAAVLGTFIIGTQQLGLSQDEGNNLTFYALSFAQLMHVFNLHSEKSFWVNEITRNRYIWYALLLCLAILAITYYVPFLHAVLNIQPMTTTELGLIVAAGVAPVILTQLVRVATKAMN